MTGEELIAAVLAEGSAEPSWLLLWEHRAELIAAYDDCMASPDTDALRNQAAQEEQTHIVTTLTFRRTHEEIRLPGDVRVNVAFTCAVSISEPAVPSEEENAP